MPCGPAQRPEPASANLRERVCSWMDRTTAAAIALLVATLLVAGWAGLRAVGDSGVHRRDGTPSELVAEKHRALGSNEQERDSAFDRIQDSAPDIGAEWHPGVIAGAVMMVAGFGYLSLFIRRVGRASSVVSTARGIAAVEALVLVIVGPLLTLVSYVGVGD